MENFTYENKTRIHFGKESMAALEQELMNAGDTVLLVIGSGSVKKSGLFDDIKAVFDKLGKELFVLEGVKGNPEIDKVYEGISICKERGVNFVLAVGGGSVIDTAKTISGGTCYDGDIWECFTQRGNITQALPLGTILTVAATGSEMNGHAVISNENEKRGVYSTEIYPQFSILNPEYTLTLPKNHTMSGLADIVAHLMESYFSKDANVIIQNTLIESLLKIVIECGYLLNKDLKNYEARESLMWASTLALNGFVTSGKTGDWSCQGLEHAVSGYYDIPHGEGLAILFPAWMEVVCNEDKELFKRFSREVLNIPDGNIEAGIEALRSYFKSLGIKGSFTEMGIPKDSIPLLVEHAFKFGSLGSFKKLTKEDGYLIYEKCF